jgi:hypothetical protein
VTLPRPAPPSVRLVIVVGAEPPGEWPAGQGPTQPIEHAPVVEVARPGRAGGEHRSVARAGTPSWAYGPSGAGHCADSVDLRGRNQKYLLKKSTSILGDRRYLESHVARIAGYVRLRPHMQGNSHPATWPPPHRHTWAASIGPGLGSVLVSFIPVRRRSPVVTQIVFGQFADGGGRR